ncbi:MAG: thioredoxin-disulfide reductase [Ruminococcaceae bacterium]|nr:thioredoxin-disulfide reductase [Oscillospiraceae bacterium]
MERIYDVIIIGGGPGGYTCALYAARAGLDTLIIERMSVGGQLTLTGTVDNYPGFDEGIEGIELGAKMQKGAERFGAETFYDEVISVELSGDIKKINAYSGAFLAKTVVIATGANPRELGLENEAKMTGRGIHYCAHCDGRFYKDKVVAVVGGGNSAVSDALYLSRLAKKVYLIHRRDTLRATKIYHDSIMKSENIEFIWNTTVESLITDKRVTGAIVKNVTTGEFSEVMCDGIFVSIGRDPATKLFEGILALDENGYIIADESTKTNIDGVYAVGDVRTKTLRQVVTAVSDGATAAHFAEEYISNK